MSYFRRSLEMRRLAKAFQNERTGWDESKHPRHPAGAPDGRGGEFAPAGGQESGGAEFRPSSALMDQLGPAAFDADDGDRANPKAHPAPFESEGYKELQASRAYQPPGTIKVGAIVAESWGYEQTNINYYEVTGISPSGKTVTLREVLDLDVGQFGENAGKAGPMASYKRALPGAYTGKPFTRRVSPDGKSVKGKYSSYASLWDGRDDYYSWYH